MRMKYLNVHSGTSNVILHIQAKAPKKKKTSTKQHKNKKPKHKTNKKKPPKILKKKKLALHTQKTLGYKTPFNSAGFGEGLTGFWKENYMFTDS